MKIEYLNLKKSTNQEISSFIKKHQNRELNSCSITEIQNWLSVKKEAAIRKIEKAN